MQETTCKVLNEVRQETERSQPESCTSDSNRLISQFLNSLDFDSLLLNNATRRAYGVTPERLISMHEDEEKSALWTWELIQPSLVLNAQQLR